MNRTKRIDNKICSTLKIIQHAVTCYMVWLHTWFILKKQVMQCSISVVAVLWYNIFKIIIYYTRSFRVPKNVIIFCNMLCSVLSTLASMKWLWLIIGTVTSASSACLSVPGCPAVGADIFALSPRFLTAENSLEWERHIVNKLRETKKQKKNSDSKYSHWIAVSIVVPEFRRIEYLFLPLQTIMKAQMMMQMSAMQTPTVIPVIDFWSKW